ncbi:hypothetical protein RJ640_000814 [Escallonia rubra]|uniref:Amidase domain-containing protein n=1 Tax=Escallonia rubra TaxID=112253 RepID=A0AA88UQ90_9ASTE|nr:hypothetical protein RJ640_000814 [Escallonia rubra]
MKQKFHRMLESKHSDRTAPHAVHGDTETSPQPQGSDGDASTNTGVPSIDQRLLTPSTATPHPPVEIPTDPSTKPYACDVPGEASRYTDDTGTTPNPYVHTGSPCGSSSGSAISVAANMVAVSLGTETHSSIICPADHNSAKLRDHSESSWTTSNFYLASTCRGKADTIRLPAGHDLERGNPPTILGAKAAYVNPLSGKKDFPGPLHKRPLLCNFSRIGILPDKLRGMFADKSVIAWIASFTIWPTIYEEKGSYWMKQRNYPSPK